MTSFPTIFETWQRVVPILTCCAASVPGQLHVCVTIALVSIYGSSLFEGGFFQLLDSLLDLVQRLLGLTFSVLGLFETFFGVNSLVLEDAVMKRSRNVAASCVDDFTITERNMTSTTS